MVNSLRIKGFGTDLSSPIDIASDWIARYGQFTSDKRICLASNLISTVNGARSSVSIVCANETAPATYYVIDASGDILWDGTNQIIYQ